MPDPLIDRPITFAGETAADIADAEAAVVRLNLHARSLIDSEAVARLLLRAEAVASSRIEGLEVGGRRLLHAQAEQVIGVPPSDVTALEVLNNIEAMTWAIGHLSDPKKKVTTADLLDIHRHLLAGTRLEEYAGQIRTERTGSVAAATTRVPPRSYHRPTSKSSSFSTISARSATWTLCRRLRRPRLPMPNSKPSTPSSTATDGRGAGLIHVILRRRGLAPSVPPPVSLVLATWSGDYVDALMDTRYRGRSASLAARRGLDRWIGLFAAATTRTVSDAELYETSVVDLQV